MINKKRQEMFARVKLAREQAQKQDFEVLEDLAEEEDLTDDGALIEHEYD